MPILQKANTRPSRLTAVCSGLARASFPEDLKRSKPEWKDQEYIQKGGAEGVFLVLDSNNQPEEQESWQ